MGVYSHTTMARIHPGSGERLEATPGEGSSAPVSARFEPTAAAPADRSPGHSSATGPRTQAGSASGAGATISVAVIGATGYAGGEAVRILARHPNVRLVGLVGRDRDHEPIGSIRPHLAGTDLTVNSTVPESDAIFLALPHGAAAAIVPEFVREGRTVIDLGPDFRLHDAADYPRWYGFEHPAPALLQGSVYGLVEWHRAELRALADQPARIVGAPGCYPTATVLALAPLARAGLIGDLVVDAKSGVSGAGRDAKAHLMFGEVNESVSAYGLGGHRHIPEIEQELAQVAASAPGGPVSNPGTSGVDFLPHLIPMTRGIFSTSHVRPTRSVSQADLDAIYAEAYDAEPFVRVVSTPPATKDVAGSNECRVYVRLDERSGRIIVIGVIDNLVKGTAGQAVQAFNLVHGLDERTGLEQLALAP